MSLTAKQPSSRESRLPSKDEFLLMAAYIKKIAGINLPYSEKNLILVAGRLRRLQRQGFSQSYRDVIRGLEQSDQRIVAAFVFALTTNTTSFFRERDHFEFLKQFLPELAGKRSRERPLHIWCSPCSTGEEAYSLGITALEALGYAAPVRILATDINEHVLAVARAGIYPLKKRQEIPDTTSLAYFAKARKDGEDIITISKTVRDLIQFGQFNLLLNYPFTQKFEVIFCRNVLIYFSPDDARYVVEKLRDQLQIGGYLFLGHSETAAGNIAGLRRVGPAIYIREEIG